MIKCQIKINSVEESKEVQDYLFSLGYTWNMGSTVCYEDIDYITKSYSVIRSLFITLNDFSNHITMSNSLNYRPRECNYVSFKEFKAINSPLWKVLNE